MTETSEQRIERVARAIWKVRSTRDWFELEPEQMEHWYDVARAADAISFRAGWDAAIEALRAHRSSRYNYEYPDVRLSFAADYLAASRPGETP